MNIYYICQVQKESRQIHLPQLNFTDNQAVITY